MLGNDLDVWQEAAGSVQMMGLIGRFFNISPVINKYKRAEIMIKTFKDFLESLNDTEMPKRFEL